MKSFTYKLHEKLNKGCNAGNGSGRPAAGQRASRAPQAPGSRRAYNNAGFSLPEIIVAMLIVGIVITPVLTNFAVTARVNAKSLKTKDVTDYAEQIIETLQSYTPDEVDEQFGSDKAEDFKIADISNTETNYGRTDSSFKTVDRKDEEKAKAVDGKPRYYFIRGAEAPSGRTYDVQITYDPTAYRTAGTADGSAHAYNLEEVPDSTAFSRSTTAIINPNDSHVTFPTGSDGKNIFNEDSQSYEFENNTSYEESAVASYYDTYTTFISKVVEKVNSFFKEKDIKQEYYIKESDIAALSKEAKMAELRSKTKRFTVISLDDINNKIALSSYLRFELDNDVYAVDETGVTASVMEKIKKTAFKNTTDEDVTLSDDDLNRIKSTISDIASEQRGENGTKLFLDYKVFYDTDGYSDLKTVYIMYKPLSNQFMSGGDTIVIDINDSKVQKRYMESKETLDFYIVPQLGLLSNKNENAYIHPAVSGLNIREGNSGTGNGIGTGGTGGPAVTKEEKEAYVSTHRIATDLTILPGDLTTFNYVKGWLDEGPNFSVIQGMAFPSVVKNTSSDLIYDLKVTVYESSSGNWKKKLVELNTSVQQ